MFGHLEAYPSLLDRNLQGDPDSDDYVETIQQVASFRGYRSNKMTSGSTENEESQDSMGCQPRISA
jgi:hypothetical protein